MKSEESGYSIFKTYYTAIAINIVWYGRKKNIQISGTEERPMQKCLNFFFLTKVQKKINIGKG